MEPTDGITQRYHKRDQRVVLNVEYINDGIKRHQTVLSNDGIKD